MPLRSPNNPNTDGVILQTIANVIHKNLAGQYCTYLAQISISGTAAEITYIQNKYKMALNMTAAIPYACHLSSGKQRYGKMGGPKSFGGAFEAILEYCARWDDQPASLDTIRATIAADLERMKANLESNESLAFGGQAYAISLPTMQLSDYKGELNSDFPGLTLVERTLSVIVDVLPYDCLT